MKKFFTADTHFTTERTLDLTRRPFKDVHEMDEVIIKNINERMTEDDILYHVGDFGSYGLVNRLNPKVVLICGNYEDNDIRDYFDGDFDNFKTQLVFLGFSDVIPSELELEDLDVSLIHHPSQRNYNKFTLFGHIHRAQMVKKNALNVGVDVHNYSPVSEEELSFWREAITKHYDNDVFCD